MPNPKKSNPKEMNPMNKIQFIRFQNPEDGLYYYKYEDDKGEVFLLSANGYKNSRSRDRGIERLRDSISYCKFIKEKGLNHFVIKSTGNNAELAKSRGFSTKKAAEEAYNWFRTKLAPEANENASKTFVKETIKTKPVSSKTSQNQRYTFRLTFYPEENSRQLRGNIEYVLGEKKSSFQGLDIEAIQAFLKENLPTYQEAVTALPLKKETQKSENPYVSELKSEKLLELKFIEEGQALDSNTISSEKNIEAQVDIMDQAETLPQEGEYEVFLFAKSLQTGKKTLAGRMMGAFPNQEKLKFPIFINSLTPGPYQILSSLKWYNQTESKEPLKEKSVNGSCYVMVY